VPQPQQHGPSKESTPIATDHAPDGCNPFSSALLCALQPLFTVDLPPGGKLPKGHTPVCSQTCIAGLQDEVLIMSSLQKPKKITFIGR
jgi:hypothetical protein